MDTMTKKVAKGGAVTLPRAVRQETGILPGVPIDISVDSQGIHIAKHVPACFHCGSVDDVACVLGLEICRKCAAIVKEEFEDVGTGKAAE